MRSASIRSCNEPELALPEIEVSSFSIRLRSGMFFCFLPFSFNSMASSCSSRLAEELDSLVVVADDAAGVSASVDTEAGTDQALAGLAGGVTGGAMYGRGRATGALRLVGSPYGELPSAAAFAAGVSTKLYGELKSIVGVGGAKTCGGSGAVGGTAGGAGTFGTSCAWFVITIAPLGCSSVFG